jgi:ankyrin repeat protein
MFLQHGNYSLGLASISDDQGSFPIHVAATMGETRIVDELVRRSPDYCEMVDAKGRNILHRAVEHGQERVVRHICQNDMFAMLLNATDFDGNTSLHLAVKYEHPRIVSLLLATTSVELGITNKDRLTARDLAERAMELKPNPNFLVSIVSYNPSPFVFSMFSI